MGVSHRARLHGFGIRPNTDFTEYTPALKLLTLKNRLFPLRNSNFLEYLKVEKIE